MRDKLCLVQQTGVALIIRRSFKKIDYFYENVKKIDYLMRDKLCLVQQIGVALIIRRSFKKRPHFPPTIHFTLILHTPFLVKD